MALESIVWVLNASVAENYSRLVALCLANHLNHHRNQGWVCWPSVESLARGARCSERQVRYCLQELIQLGELEVLERAGGRGKTAVYRMPKFEAWYASQKGAQYAPFTPERGHIASERGHRNDGKGAQQPKNEGPYHNTYFNRNRTVKNPADNSSADTPPLPQALQNKKNRLEIEAANRREALVGAAPEMPPGTRINSKVLEREQQRRTAGR